MAAPAEELDVAGTAVRLSSPDKIYFPALGAEGGTKRHLVEYYRAVAWTGRPPRGPLVQRARATPGRRTCSASPTGSRARRSTRSDLPRTPPITCTRLPVPFPSGRHADALWVDGPRPPVVWAANLSWPWSPSTPWRTRATEGAGRTGWTDGATTTTPTSCASTSTPSPAPGFEEARVVALDVLAKPLLDGLGVRRALEDELRRPRHPRVRAHRAALHEIREVRRAAVALAREVERRAGGKGHHRVVEGAARRERIFIDYNQNARDHTIASAYSARNTPRATVSTPLTWDEYLVDADPDDLTIATVPGAARAARRPDGRDRRRRSTRSRRSWSSPSRTRRAVSRTCPIPRTSPKMPGEPKRVQPSRARDDA